MVKRIYVPERAMCPITAMAKGYAFEVPVLCKNIKGVVLADHLRSVDWDARHVEFIGRVAQNVKNEVHEKLIRLIEL